MRRVHRQVRVVDGGSVAEACRYFQQQLEDLLSADRMLEVAVVLEELLMNLSTHAAAHGAVPADVTITSTPEGVHMVLADRAPPFDPSRTPAPPPDAVPGGRGLLLVHGMSASVAYRRTEDGRNVTECRFPPSEAALDSDREGPPA